MMILTVFGTSRMILKGLKKSLEEMEMKERTEVTETTESLRSTRILSNVLETWEDLLSLLWNATS